MANSSSLVVYITGNFILILCCRIFPHTLFSFPNVLQTTPWFMLHISDFQVSEGLDFTDHAGRAVVITGMPFATRTDPKVS